MVTENIHSILNLTLKALITTAADDIHKYFFIVFQIRRGASNESSARQRIQMKNQALISLKDKNRKLKCRLLQFLFDALRLKCNCCARFGCKRITLVIMNA